MEFRQFLNSNLDLQHHSPSAHYFDYAYLHTFVTMGMPSISVSKHINAVNSVLCFRSPWGKESTKPLTTVSNVANCNDKHIINSRTTYV